VKSRRLRVGPAIAFSPASSRVGRPYQVARNLLNRYRQARDRGAPWSAESRSRWRPGQRWPTEPVDSHLRLARRSPITAIVRFQDVGRSNRSPVAFRGTGSRLHAGRHRTDDRRSRAGWLPLRARAVRLASPTQLEGRTRVGDGASRLPVGDLQALSSDVTVHSCSRIGQGACRWCSCMVRPRATASLGGSV
jgi:hypothetical protein